MATRWQEGVCRLWRQAGSSPVEENTAAMPCWAQRRLESQCTVSTSSSSQDPSDIALPGLQPLPITHSVSTRTHSMHSVSQHTHTHPWTVRWQYLQTSTITFYMTTTEDRITENRNSTFYISTSQSPITHPFCILLTKMVAGPSVTTHLFAPKPHGHEKPSVFTTPSATTQSIFFLSSSVVHGIQRKREWERRLCCKEC